MNLKVKFAILFSVLVFVILFASDAIIYTLYDKSRQEEFHRRLSTYAVHTYENYFQTNNDTANKTDWALALFVAESKPAAVILDKSYRVVYNYPYTSTYHIDYDLLNTLRKKKQVYFKKGDLETVGVYVNSNRKECFTIVTATDVIGLEKLYYLRLIIGFVLLIGVLLTGIAGFFYMYVLSKPLEKLGSQMQRITENNLQERVLVTKNNEFAGIASNFNDMLERLQKGFEFQKSFVDHASHELRTPLAVMLAQTESALRRNISGDEVNNLLKSLREDQQDMIELTNSLLLLSQYEKLSYSTDWPLLRIDEVLYESVASTKRMLEGVKIAMEFGEMNEENMSLSIHGNDPLLRSAFRNLIKNAFTYSEDQAVKIIIETVADKIKIHFINKGKILEPHEQEKLFIPFFRGLNSQQKRGFGLGLSIVTRIISLHKGEIAYEAVNGNENKFTIVFDSIKE